MDKKKKTRLVLVVAVMIIAIVMGWVWYLLEKGDTQEGISKVSKLYETLQAKNTYSFTTTLNNENQMFYAKQGNKAYTDTIYNGSESKFIIKDGNSYLLMDERKVYYTYANNETDLNKVEVQLNTLKDMEYETGKEEIENKTYSYEEYQTITDFAMNYISENEENQEGKTRLYFKNNNLVYIKTILGEKEELLKVDISDKVDSELFEIPSNYKAM